MPGQAPTIMVSSTFYDLKEVRQALSKFIESDLGYRPLISESPEFPIDPTSDTIENCRRQVEESADILVLVIGRRYGFVDKSSGKSITSLEYLGARAKGIPIYVFVDKSTLTLFQEWRVADEQTRSALAKTVENGKLFEFIDQIRSTDSVWTFGFDAAAEITESLRAQLAYQMVEGLRVQQFLRTSPETEFLRKLRGKTLRLALEQPTAWEHRLFASAVNDEVALLHELRKEYDLRLSFGVGEYVKDEDFPAWVQLRIGELQRLTDATNRILNEILQTAFRPSGTPGSAPEIVFAAQRTGRIYKDALEWAINVRRAFTNAEDLREPIQSLALCSESIIINLGGWGSSITSGIEQALLNVGSGPSQRLNFTITLDPARMTEFNELVTEVYRRRHGGQDSS